MSSLSSLSLTIMGITGQACKYGMEQTWITGDTIMKYYLLAKAACAFWVSSRGNEPWHRWGWELKLTKSQDARSYIDNAENFVDTANVYTNGSSEKMLENLGEKRGKSFFLPNTRWISSWGPNGGGKHRKSRFIQFEISLQRLRTDYIDLLYLHAWMVRHLSEEILRGMVTCSRGKGLYVGIRILQRGKSQECQHRRSSGWFPLVVLQIETISQRTTERELISKEMNGTRIVPFSPLANGLLSENTLE